MKQQTKKKLAGFLIFMMLFTMLPTAALAAEEPAAITITNDNVNVASNAYLVDDNALVLGRYLELDVTHSFVLGPNTDGSAFTFLGVNIGGSQPSREERLFSKTSPMPAPYPAAALILKAAAACL